MVSQLRILVGTPAQLEATVAGMQPTGTVDFLLLDNSGALGYIVQSVSSDGLLGTSLVHGGVATMSVDPLPVGSYRVIAGYSGDGANLPSSSTLVEIEVLPRPTPSTPEGPALAGEPIPVSGSGYEPGSTVTIRHAGIVVATVVVDESGSFSTVVRLPSTATGSQQLSVTGVDAIGTELVSEVAVEVTGTLPSAGGSTDLAGTAMLILLAGLMLLAGSRITWHRRS